MTNLYQYEMCVTKIANVLKLSRKKQKLELKVLRLLHWSKAYESKEEKCVFKYSNISTFLPMHVLFLIVTS